jgi:hypothetical protein
VVGAGGADIYAVLADLGTLSFQDLGSQARNLLLNMSVKRPYKGMPLEMFVISGGF